MAHGPGLRDHVVHVDRGPLAQRMVPGAEHHAPVVKGARSDRHRLHLAGWLGCEHDVDLAIGECPFQPVFRGDRDFDRQMRGALRDLGQNWGQEGARDSLHAAQANSPAPQPSMRLHRVACELHFVEDQARAGQQIGTSGREMHAACVALEQGVAELPFQQLDVPRNRRLGRVEGMSRATHAAKGRDGIESCEQAPIELHTKTVCLFQNIAMDRMHRF